MQEKRGDAYSSLRRCLTSPIVFGVLVAFGMSGVLGSGIAKGAPGAVPLHEPELPGAATVWCLDHPKKFADAARAVGLDIGTAQDGSVFQRPGNRQMNLQEWSISANPDDAEDFDSACLPAFEASGAVAVSAGKSEDQTLDTILAVLLGAGLATGSSVGIERWRLNRRDADDLRQLGLDLREAASDYTVDPSNGPAIARAQAAARKLKTVLGEFEDVAPRNVKKAKEAIGQLLADPPPRIGNLGDSTEEDLMGRVSTIREKVEKIASRAAHPRQSRLRPERDE